MNTLRRILPNSIKKHLRPVKEASKAIYARGLSWIKPWAGKYYCPCCEKRSHVFCSYGNEKGRRANAQCPYCGSLERHRFLWKHLIDNQILDRFRNKPALHVAPEPSLTKLLQKKLGSGYLTADFLEPNVMVKMDITDIQYPDNSFDFIYCSHVLEHVSDDIAAMKEFRRVLKPDGLAILLVPILVEKTFEDPSIVDPDERNRVYGQHDHVRIYGPDFEDRLRDSGFSVETIKATDFFSPKDYEELSLKHYEGHLYFCRK